MAKAKIEELDYLRGIAIIAIVMQHVIGYVNHPQAVMGDIIVLTVIWHLIIFGVPAFMLISGAALFHNYGSMENFKYKEFLQKRGGQILLPYLLWTLFYYYSNHLYTPGTYVSFWWQIKNFFYYVITGRASYHLWYIVVIFQFYLLFPLFQKYFLLLRAKLITSRGVLVVIASFLFLHLFLNWFYIEVLHQSEAELVNSLLYSVFIEYSYLLFILWLFYFALGGIGVLYSARSRQWLRNLLPFNLLAWSGLLLYLLINYGNSMIWMDTRFVINVNALTLYKPIVALFAVSTLINIYPISHWLTQHSGSIFSRLLKITGQYSFSIYLAHPYVIDLLTKKLYSFPLFSPTQKFLLSVVYTFIIIIYCNYVLKRVLFFINNFFASANNEINKYPDKTGYSTN